MAEIRERYGPVSYTHLDLKPTLVFEFLISGAGGVGMNAVALGQLAGAGQAIAGGELVAQDAKDDLGAELLAKVNVAVSV